MGVKVGYIMRKPKEFCCLCGGLIDGDRSVEHIIPISKGGSNHAWNKSISHVRCNNNRMANTWVLPLFSTTTGKKLPPASIKRIMSKALSKIRR